MKAHLESDLHMGVKDIAKYSDLSIPTLNKILTKDLGLLKKSPLWGLPLLQLVQNIGWMHIAKAYLDQ